MTHNNSKSTSSKQNPVAMTSTTGLTNNSRRQSESSKRETARMKDRASKASKKKVPNFKEKRTNSMITSNMSRHRQNQNMKKWQWPIKIQLVMCFTTQLSVRREVQALWLMEKIYMSILTNFRKKREGFLSSHMFATTFIHLFFQKLFKEDILISNG